MSAAPVNLFFAEQLPQRRDVQLFLKLVIENHEFQTKTNFKRLGKMLWLRGSLATTLWTLPLCMANRLLAHDTHRGHDAHKFYVPVKPALAKRCQHGNQNRFQYETQCIAAHLRLFHGGTGPGTLPARV